MTDSPRRFSLPKLYAITDSRLSGLSHSAQVDALCSGGARMIQLREKLLGADEFYAEAKRAIGTGLRYGAKILINDRVDIALAAGAHGVHLGQTDLPAEEARRILGKNSIIGLSTHNLQQGAEATRLPIDYLAVGPMFPTDTKSDTAAPLGLAGLNEIRVVVEGLPLVAIGGINANRAREILQAGAVSVAMVSSLISDPQRIEERTRELLALIGT
jgi:thiamine-phosphate pyrophosphorylase